jgi:hypothetical protein
MLHSICYCEKHEQNPLDHGESNDATHVDKFSAGPAPVHRWLRRPDHHGKRRGCPAAVVAGEAGRDRAGGPHRQPHRPARFSHREINRRWYQANTGRVITDVQQWRRHPTLRWMAATLDGRVEGSDVFESKFMLPWSFSEEAAAQKHMPQLQHNMWVVAARASVLSVITGGGKWVEIKIHADPLYQHLIVTAERKFWRCVESGEPPALFGVEPPKPRIEAARIVDMSSSNAWADFAGVFASTRSAHLEHEQAKAELKRLMPEDAQQAIGHGVRAKRSKSGAVSFDLLGTEDSRAEV